MMNRIKIKSLVLIALAGSVLSIATHAYLAITHYQLKLGIFEGKSICNVNAHFNCDAVSLSKYADFLSIPLAIWGAATHAILVVLLITWLLGLAQNRDQLLRQCYALASLILLASLVMLGVSGFLLSTYCLFCIATYLLSIFIWLGLWQAERRNRLESKSNSTWGQSFAFLFRSQRWILVCFALIPGIAWMINAMIIDSYNANDLPEMIANRIAAWQAAPLRSLDEHAGFVLERSPQPAKMTIVEFADFLCPHCRAAAEPLHNFFESHPEIRLVMKLYPLDGTCNSDIKMHLDGLRCDLAAAAYCAESISKKGWVTHDYIFDHQVSWNKSNLDSLLKQMYASLDLAEQPMQECIKSSAVHDQIIAIAKEASGIEGTPTIFVNGKQLREGQMPAVLQAAAASLGL